MGSFFDQYDDGAALSGLSWIAKEEKSVLIDDAVAFPINAVTRVSTKFGPRFVVQTEIQGEPRAIGFAAEKVFSRDRLLTAAQEYLANGGEPPVVVMELEGRAVVLRDAAARG